MKKIFFILLCFFNTLNAANWLMLQGTEPKVGHNLWGFAQLRYQNNYGNIYIKNGINTTPFSFIKPDLTKTVAFNVARLRPGIRGSLDAKNKINYFVLAEFAQNGVNYSLGEQTHNYLMDASLTFKYLPLYIRIGRFKYAGSEEGNMARFTSAFITFSTVGDQLMLERFLDTTTPSTSNPDLYIAKPKEGTGAYRDTGIQIFQSFELQKHSYLTFSYMLGAGLGLENSFSSNNLTHYTYASYENILGKGKGYRQEAFKAYIWYQHGKRELANRIRYGTGFAYFYNQLRIEAEYMKGYGMIYTGAKDTDASPSINNWQYSLQASTKNEADGYYILSSYGIHKNIDLMARYDVYNRMTNIEAQYRNYKSLTTGFSYKFQGYDRLDLNYAFNDARAPYNTSADAILTKLGNLLSIQYTIVFK